MDRAFLVVGGLATGVFLFAIWQRAPRWLRALTTGSFAALLVVMFVTRPSELGPTPWVQKSPWREIAFFLAMASGTAARYLTKAIEDRRKVQANSSVRRRKVPLHLDAWEFAYPYFFSVLTFGALLGQIQGKGVDLATIILSFQNGFFWQTLLGSSSKAEPPAGSG